MTVRPILFSAPMVRAILREIEKPGTGKTQTRRTLSAENLRIWSGGLDFPGKNVKWPAPEFAEMMARNARDFRLVHGIVDWKTDPAPYQGEAAFASWQGRLCYDVGDVLWVRETCSGVESHDGLDCIRYDADQVWLPIENTADAAELWLDLHHYGKRRGASVPSIHMPRWASRLTLEVTNVRVERLQDISEDDAKAEGCDKAFEVRDLKDAIRQIAGAAAGEALPSTYRCGYAKLWDDINGAGSWSQNPWVVAVSFTPHAMNVDVFLAQKEAA